MTSRARLILVGVALVSLLLTDTASVLARAGSGGSRGSRSYSTPARPSSPASPTTPSSPSPALTQPSPSLQRPSFFGGLMGGIAGFALGGLLGSMLFGGMGGGFGGGIGLLELLLIGGATFSCSGCSADARRPSLSPRTPAQAAPAPTARRAKAGRRAAGARRSRRRRVRPISSAGSGPSARWIRASIQSRSPAGPRRSSPTSRGASPGGTLAGRTIG